MYDDIGYVGITFFTQLSNPLINRYENTPSLDYLCTKDGYIKGGHDDVYARSVQYKKFATRKNFKGL